MGRYNNTDNAYEDAQRELFKEFRASMTRVEYAAWQLRRFRFVLLGAGVTAAIAMLIMKLI